MAWHTGRVKYVHSDIRTDETVRLMRTNVSTWLDTKMIHIGLNFSSIFNDKNQRFKFKQAVYINDVKYDWLINCSSFNTTFKCHFWTILWWLFLFVEKAGVRKRTAAVKKAELKRFSLVSELKCREDKLNSHSICRHWVTNCFISSKFGAENDRWLNFILKQNTKRLISQSYFLT